ncbi:Sodium/hydrogen exchanger family-domain-containing protein [Mycena amicta]|nr:Sodium/hydrogen exchanger family-domain-containing protein [Mycena amicta]
MHFDPFEVSVAHIAYAALGGFVVLFGMFSLLLRERLYIGEACWAFLFGVVIGPYGANIFNPRGWAGDNVETVNSITLELTRVVLAIGVFAIGVELPKAYMRRHWQSLFFLLGPIMIWGWFVSAAFIFALIPGLNFLSSLAVAACLTPTDPILAAAVVGGKWADKHVPAHIRHLLAAESGCNDGAAFPFLYIALYLILDQSTNEAIKDWFLKLWLYQVILGVLIGSVIGFTFRHLMKFSQRHSLIDRHSYIAQYVSLALLTIGLTTLLGSDDLLSAFACGAAFAWDGFFNRQTEESVFSSVIDLLFNVASFVYIGAWMPFSQFSDPQGTTLQVWRLIVIAILVLLFRRLPAMIAFYRWIPDIKTFREAVFSGHFGPIGVGAVFISTLAAEVLHTSPLAEEDEQVALLLRTIQPICAFMVMCSIAVHGLSIPGFSLGRRVHSVSRTWSKHTTATATTNHVEWMDHVRRAEGGVVVNRDERRIGDLEEGPSGVAPSPSPSPSGEKDLEEVEGRALEEIQVRRVSEGANESDEKENGMPEGEVPPDGEELVSEWQEGPHRIIERRAGPGEEVEVEIIRNVDGEDVSSAYRGSEAVVHHMVDKLKSGPQTDLEALGRTIEERLRGSPLPGFHHRHRDDHEDDDANEEDDDEEEGWASEDEPAATSSRPRSKNKSPKAAVAKRRGSGGRKGLLGHAQQFMREHRSRVQPLPLPLSAATDLAYSSSSPSSPSSSPSPSSPNTTTVGRPPMPIRTSTGRRSRVDSLRASGSGSGSGSGNESRRHSRDASPARSVRFASVDPGSGSDTTRVGGGVGGFGEEVVVHGHGSPLVSPTGSGSEGERAAQE